MQTVEGDNAAGQLYWRLYAREAVPEELKALTGTWTQLLHNGMTLPAETHAYC